MLKNGWGIDAVIETTQAKLKKLKKSRQPITLMLDATMEKHGDMEKLLQRFADAIACNHLAIVVCKSYQKYSSLCSGKVMAGAVAIISADNRDTQRAKRHLNIAEQDMDWMSNNSSQLLIHFLNNRDHEFNLHERSLENALFVSRTLFSGKDEQETLDRHEHRQPFGVMLNTPKQHPLSLCLAKGNQTFHLNRLDHIADTLIPSRDSFAFADTIKTRIPADITDTDASLLRIAFGQESKAQLTEYFYMPARLMKADGSRWSCQDASKLIQKLANDVVTEPASLPDKLIHIGRQEQQAIDDHTRLTADPLTLQRQNNLENNPNNLMTLNKVASVINHLGAMVMAHTRQEMWVSGGDRKILNHLLNAIIRSGMPGVSSSSRDHIVNFQAFLSGADMSASDEHQQQQSLITLLATVTRMPGSANTAKYLMDIPDTVFRQATRTNQGRTVQTLFLPLDARSQLSLLNDMMAQQHSHKLSACMDGYEARREQSSSRSAAKLSSSMGIDGVTHHHLNQLQTDLWDALRVKR